MNVKLLVLLFVVSLVSCETKVKNHHEIEPISIIDNDGVQIPVYDFDHFEPFLNQEDDTIYVINFWATWCKPCVEELPYFEQIHEEYKNKNVEVILVSLDFEDQVESRLIPFINKNNVNAEVVFLNDSKGNTWIPKVDASWSGAIPATLIYNASERHFYEKSMTYDELDMHIKKLL